MGISDVVWSTVDPKQPFEAVYVYEDGPEYDEDNPPPGQWFIWDKATEQFQIAPENVWMLRP